jgi:hypothetical protein
MFPRKRQPQFLKSPVRLPGFQSAIFSEFRIGPHPDFPPGPFRGVAPIWIFLSPIGNRGDRSLTMRGVIRFSSGLRLFGIGIGHKAIMSYAGINVNTGWTP